MLSGGGRCHGAPEGEGHFVPALLHRVPPAIKALTPSCRAEGEVLSPGRGPRLPASREPDPRARIAVPGASFRARRSQDQRRPSTGARTRARTRSIRGGHRGAPWLGELLRHRRGSARGERGGPRAHRRGCRYAAAAPVSLLADGAERDQSPARRGQPQEDRSRDDRGRRRRVAATGGLHVPGPVRRPRPDVRQDDGHARRARLSGPAPAGSLTEPRPRFALRRRADRSRVGEVLRSRRHPPEDGQDGRVRGPSCEGRLRPAARGGQHERQEAKGDHSGPAERREPRGRPDAPRVHPLPQPCRRHAPELGAAFRSSSRRRASSSPSTTSGCCAPTTSRASANRAS